MTRTQHFFQALASFVHLVPMHDTIAIQGSVSPPASEKKRAHSLLRTMLKVAYRQYVRPAKQLALRTSYHVSLAYLCKDICEVLLPEHGLMLMHWAACNYVDALGQHVISSILSG